MGLRHTRLFKSKAAALTIACGLLVLGASLAPSSAEAARRGKTRFDGIRDCERIATLQQMKHHTQFRRLSIDRTSVSADRYAAPVGNLFIATVYHGRAHQDLGAGQRTVRFVCLHGGLYRSPVFVHILPE